MRGEVCPEVIKIHISRRIFVHLSVIDPVFVMKIFYYNWLQGYFCCIFSKKQAGTLFKFLALGPVCLKNFFRDTAVGFVQQKS